MFFYLSKIFWIVARPLNALVLAALFSYLLYRMGFIRTGRVLLSMVLVAGFLVCYTQLPDYLLGKVESDFKIASLETPPHGIIILGGAVDNLGHMHGRNGQWGADFEIADGAERILKGVELARQYPQARVIFTGGSSAIFNKETPEADIARILIGAISDVDSRIEFEGKSRNTAENATNSAKMIGAKDADKNWLLITSAYHMKRALGAFRKAGINVQAVPVDYRARKPKFPYLTPYALYQLRKTDLWVHEIIGDIAYKLSGKGQ